MKIKVFTAVLIVLSLISCDSNYQQAAPKQETPKALEDKSSFDEVLSKRGSEDLVEGLYAEIVRKNTDLKMLEDKIEELSQSKDDSTDLFDKFDKKNESYYNSANRHIEMIKDSLLRGKIKILIDNSLAKYNSSIARHSELLKTIEAKNMAISDLHNLLKIVKTLPLIEKYQKENLPDTKALEGFIKKQDATLNYADTVSKK